MKEILLIKYGEIILKGLNRHIFENKLVENIRLVTDNRAKVYKSLATIYAEPFEDEDIESMAEKISKVFGVVHVIRTGVVEKELKKISSFAVDYLGQDLKNHSTFKVETKRADKKFPLKSPEVSRLVGGDILGAYPHLKVNVTKPDIVVNVEIREAAAYVYGAKIAGPGGMPSGTSGLSMLLLSGGIDSPVAGYMLAKRGAKIEGVHFHSPPFTGERAKQKVLDLAGILGEYTGGMKVHMVPFTEQQLLMREKCPPEHLTLLMRRMMMMIASEIGRRRGALSLITGESLGQVASQTMEALAVTDDAASITCFRPLIGMDKEDIVRISRKIGSYETSILPYEDCCTIFVPKHPTTKPKLEKILLSESRLDVEAMVKKAVDETEIIEV